ncbi:MAG: R3H domain-containing nucleic acid-binding protein, partial [Dehalococcoidia bacterium]|nr:R3H domain-containing nucleic acid-binding protein [Dehalococcoidia bacterium]
LEHLKIQSSLSAVPYPSMSEEDARPSIALDISLKGEDQALLIGRRGQTLVSLQYITNLILSVNNKNLSPVTVDVEGYKQRRFKSLQSLALRLAEQVRTSRRPATMEPMPPNERRIVHLTLSKWDDIDTESSGEGENRKVVIKYRGM